MNALASDFENHGSVCLVARVGRFSERPIRRGFFGRYLTVVALPLHNMTPKKRKQDCSDAEAADDKPEPEIDHARLAIEHISHCTLEQLNLVGEAIRRRQDRC